MTTSIWRAFLHGWLLVIKHPLLVIFKWLLNLICALLIVGPIYESLSAYWNHSPLSRAWFARMDRLFFLEFFDARADELFQNAGYWLFMVGLFGLLNLYLTGGILETFRRKQTLGPRVFFGACGIHFGSLFMTTLASLVLFLILVSLPFYLLELAFEYLEPIFPNENVLIPFYFAGIAVVGVLCVTWVARVHDYARILVCRTGFEQPHRLTRTLAAFFQAIGFTFRHYWKSLLLWLLFLAGHFVWIVLFRWLAPDAMAGLNETSPSARVDRALLVSLGMGQFLILLRLATGIAALGGQMHFWNGFQESKPTTTPSPFSPQTEKPPAAPTPQTGIGEETTLIRPKPAAETQGDSPLRLDP